RDLEKYDTGRVSHEQEKARLAVREAELELERAAERQGRDSNAHAEAAARLEAAQAEFAEIETWALAEFDRIRMDIDSINQQNAKYQMLMQTSGEGPIASQTTLIPLDQIVRAYPANRLSMAEKVSIYLGRWREFLIDEPREANAEGGVFPAIFGTVAMTLIMSILVVPFGVLAALYLREYAKAGPLVSAVRIAVNNLAGVPSIVFGVFGLGFFCYVMGASIDQLFFAANLPNPTYGKGGLLWASFTLALLTLPVVIVATEEAVSAVPSSMREGSYACGASKWQTIQRIVLPRALPGIITGLILALARGAGEVAPLMLVGAVKLAPELPIDGIFPFIHPERSFMHLGFHIYDVGFQSQNSEAAKPMVYTTTLLLITIIASLNLATIWLRNRLRRKFAAGAF
ncbi:MAG: phosphate ABC transporter permease PstA, partial [Acidobacteriota bacterium]